MSVQSTFENAWYGNHLWVWLLAPLSLLFAAVTLVRRGLYKVGLLASSKPPIPVIIVGNISVGGNGKTPVVIALCEYLQNQGHTVGVLSRGYKGTRRHFPHVVSEQDSSATVGDEPYLIYKRLGCQVVIDPKRARGARSLYAQNCSVIVCDDGLQHYALGRDIELVVMDSRGVGNGFLLPMGPLRETRQRLKSVSMLIKNGDFDFPFSAVPQTSMNLSAMAFVNVADPTISIPCDEFASNNDAVTALCGIGNPQRFYQSLETLGVHPTTHKSFPDHHHFAASDLPDGTLVMTEKDAVKCQPFAKRDWWYLKITAVLPQTFYAVVDNKLNEIENKRKEIQNGI